MAKSSAKAEGGPQFVYKRPYLTPYQEAFVDDPSLITVVEASTKVGKTVACLVWLLEKACGGKRGQNFWWVAPVYTQAAIAFRRIKDYLPQAVYTANEADMKIVLFNGTTIWFKSAEKFNNLYGEDVFACVIDEATRCDQEAWYAIVSTLTATHGPVKIIGNVVGRRNWAYELARKAEAQSLADATYHKITVWDAVDAGVLKRQDIEDRRKVLPAHVFKQLYECIPADDGGNPFGLDAIDACIRPMSDGEPVVWGWDLARVVDWTVGIALDQHGHVCRFERWHANWTVTRSNIAAITRNVPALIDSTGVGDPMVQFLQEQGGEFTAFHFTGPSKQNLMERLAMAIHQGQIGFPADSLPSRPLVSELKSFEYTYVPTGVRYSAPSGEHDDCVIALALAVWHWRNVAGGSFLVVDGPGDGAEDVVWTKIA